MVALPLRSGDIAATGSVSPAINPITAACKSALAYPDDVKPDGVVQRADRSAAGRRERRELRGALGEMCGEVPGSIMKTGLYHH